MEPSNSRNNRGEEDYIPLSKTPPPRKHFKMKNPTNQSNEPRRSIHGDRKLYSRLVEGMEKQSFANDDSLVDHLQQKYPEYKRKKKDVLRKSVREGLNMIANDLGGKDKDEEINDVSYNVINSSLTQLYNNNNINDEEGKTKTKKQRREQAQVNKEIDATLAKQARLREKYVLAPKLSFEDFGGISVVVEELKKLMLHIKNPQHFRYLGVEPPRGFLLHGPPGVGKSQLVEALASYLQVPFLRCAATEIIAGISGESEEKIRELFALAKSLRPCLLFIDEIDAITPKRENAAREMERRIVTQLIASIDELANSDGSGDGVMVIGATNRVDALDPALRRADRFDKELALGIPDEVAREEILRVLCRGVKLGSDIDFQLLAHNTPGYVGADLKSLVREAAMLVLEKAGRDGLIPMNDDDGENKMDVELNISIEMSDLLAATKAIQPSSKREGFATVPDVTWDDVGALSTIRHELQMSILAPIRYQADVAKLGLSLSAGILLCGPPGCGKTLLAKAIANESGINFISVKGPELLNMYVGESERAVRAVFARAKNSKPCVIFFDEIDSLCPKRSDSESNNASARVVNQLLTEMDGLESRQCFLLAATNRPDIIDPAILRPGRLDKVLYVNFPSASDRADILRTLTRNGTRPPLSSDVDLGSIAIDSRLEGFTGADLYALVREASLMGLEERVKGLLPKEQELVLCKAHFERALNKVKPSVNEYDRKIYTKLYHQYYTQEN